MPAHPSVIAALTAALEASPEDVGLRLHLASLLLESGEYAGALEQYGAMLARDPAHLEAIGGAARAAEGAGDQTRAQGYRRLLQALGSPAAAPETASLPHGDPLRPELQREPEESPPDWNRLLRPPEELLGGAGPLRVSAEPGMEDEDADDWKTERPEITLAEVGGMEEVKRRLNMAFLAPLRNPEIVRTYGKSLRGGLLLYGPPGCGKTFIARALAGELGAKFLAIGLADILDMWLGESERKLREVFDTARRNAPAVLFFDEIDALGQKRSHLKGHAGRNVVNQLLAEMDSVGANNEGVFVLAASNHPWDVDTALRRPGRFDRMMLVLPPDEPARETILRIHLKGRPAGDVDIRWIAGRTAEFSGADLAHLCETAVESAMEEALTTGRARPLSTNDFKKALREVRPSTRPWFEIARNYAMFANEGGMYDDLLTYIKVNRI